MPRSDSITRSSASTTAPPLQRGAMTPLPWIGLRQGLQLALRGRLPGPNPSGDPRWARAARQRRGALLMLIVLIASAAALLQLSALPDAQTLWDASPWKAVGVWLFIGLFSLLFGWVCAGFGTALMGFWVMLRGDPMALRVDDAVRKPISREARTAIVMPICNEDVDAVFENLAATCESLAATGVLSSFDLFVLSDTRVAETRAAELRAFERLRRIMGDDPAHPHVFYRWRRRSAGKKAGNLADFCRRWGRAYRYMVVLDADSVMTGDCLVRMVQVMEAYPRVGIAQTAPEACAPDTLHARAQQFSNRVLGRLYVAGLQYWQLGDSHYWGHNAIIRVEPFMKHCALAKLPTRDGAGVEILSHDFVEAALMRRAGYEVWMVPELRGSYEQLPAHLLDELQRDHRWCRGNMRNARLIAEPGLAGVHRSLFLVGVMAYASAPLWLGYVILGFLTAGAGRTPGIVSTTALWVLTVTMLALPRVLASAAIWLRGEAREFGGLRGLLIGTLMEGLLATLQAPVRMLAHSWSVFTAVVGRGAGWKSPPRQALQVRWRDAVSQLSGWSGVIGFALLVVGGAQPEAAPRLMLLAAPLLLTIPLVVWTSRVDWGTHLRRVGLLRVPMENRVPWPLRPAELVPQMRDQARALVLTAWGKGSPARWAARGAAGVWMVFAMMQPPANQPRFDLERADFDTTLLAWNEVSPLTRPMLASVETSSLRRSANTKGSRSAAGSARGGSSARSGVMPLRATSSFTVE